jgi:hypothetical protein
MSSTFSYLSSSVIDLYRLDYPLFKEGVQSVDPSSLVAFLININSINQFTSFKNIPIKFA